MRYFRVSEKLCLPEYGNLKGEHNDDRLELGLAVPDFQTNAEHVVGQNVSQGFFLGLKYYLGLNAFKKNMLKHGVKFPEVSNILFVHLTRRHTQNIWVRLKKTKIKPEPARFSTSLSPSSPIDGFKATKTLIRFVCKAECLRNAS
jgi:hypothetical protein